jgi:CRISPR-associated endoribonuclease Cas6
VQQVEKLPVPALGNTASFRCLSPIVVSRAQPENGKLKAKYLSPEDEGYQRQLFNNLIRRYQTAVQYQYQASAPAYELLDGPDSESFDFQLLHLHYPLYLLFVTAKLQADEIGAG